MWESFYKESAAGSKRRTGDRAEDLVRLILENMKRKVGSLSFHCLGWLISYICIKLFSLKN